MINSINSVRTYIKAMTPYEIYMMQVQGVMDGIRAARAGKDYIPPQLGGPFSQRSLIEEKMTLQVINFNMV